LVFNGILIVWQVIAQDGDFYGGWCTPEIEGGDRGFKGGMLRVSLAYKMKIDVGPGPGTWGW
jgi:hypothetical protein